MKEKDFYDIMNSGKIFTFLTIDFKKTSVSEA